jgi:purine-binding chemotaxis protein CheW
MAHQAIPSGVNSNIGSRKYGNLSSQVGQSMNPTTAITTDPPAAAVGIPEREDASAQYLTFICANEEYGVDILRVQEIRGWAPVTRLPEAPHDVMGVLNLRGSIVSVVSLRARFGLEPKPVDASTVVIVLRVRNGVGNQTVGICVDGVSDVHNIAANAIMAKPDIDGRPDDGSVSGLVTLNDRTVMLLNIDRLLGGAGTTGGTPGLNG